MNKKKEECLHEMTCRDWPKSALRIICADCGMDLYEMVGDLRAKLIAERKKKEKTCH